MSNIDWSLLIGYTQEDAEQYLVEENATYNLRVTAPARPGQEKTGDPEEMRVIGVRWVDNAVELICAKIDWSVI